MSIRVVLASLATSIAVAGAGSAANAATCAGQAASANDPGGGNLQLRVACDTPIANGSLSIGMNRGASNVTSTPAYTGTAGDLKCRSEEQAPGSKFDSIITCTGSLPAQTKVVIGAETGPNPCGDPPFAAQMTVQFGDGQTAGPQDFPPIVECEGGGPGGGPQDPGPGKNFDPGGVFMSGASGLPSKATVAKARSGLAFTMKLGVKGRVTVTIEVAQKVMGSWTKRISGGRTSLMARLSAKAARDLEGRRTHAKVHVEVKPNASEGFTTHGRRYFKLTLTG
jgi:hypothetical protein